ncbi:winged helix-turn-helix transcriptional regulator [bacterium]|nr:winged helix-turn-helix transcriptional regulator [bacterium]
MERLKEKLAPQLIDFAADMLKCVGHPARLRIVEFLESNGEAPVNQIQEELDLPQPVVSQHLTKMKALGLLRARRAQGMVFYSVALPQLFKLLDCIRGCDPNMQFRNLAG